MYHLSKIFIGDYRFGFNGMEKVSEQYGEGNAYDFGARMMNVRLGRWMSIDPLAGKYPFVSPYQFVNNCPIIYVDVDGKKWRNPYKMAINAEQRLPIEKQNAEKIKALTELSNTVDQLLIDFSKNDPQLYSYIETLEFNGESQYVNVFLNADEFKSTHARVAAYPVIYKSDPDNIVYYTGGDFDGQTHKGIEYVNLPMAKDNFNIILFENSPSPMDENLANEVGDIMFMVENPDRSIKEKSSDDYRNKQSTFYSFNVEGMYRARKNGVEPKDSDVYPLQPSRREDSRKINYTNSGGDYVDYSDKADPVKCIE